MPARPAAPQAAFPEQAEFGQAGGLTKDEKMIIKTENPETKEQIKKRLSRIEGQLRGVQRMIDEDRDCRDVLQQLIAIRSAVQAASLNFMQDVASDCLMNPADQDDPEAQRAMMVDLIKMLGKVS
jgi:DNA-binding FrmR family transcriptional regulator